MIIKFISDKLSPEFEVYEESKILIHIKIDTEVQTFRITCLDTKRVFFVVDEVIKKATVTTLLNEYSQRLGSLIKSKSALNSGEIEIEGIQYTYTFSDDFIKEINLFEQNSRQPALRCKLEPGQPSILNEGYLNYLLFSMAWFKFLCEKQPAFAEMAEI